MAETPAPTTTLPEAYEQLKESTGADVAATHKVHLLTTDDDGARELWLVAKGSGPAGSAGETWVWPFFSDRPEADLLAELETLKEA